MANISLDIKANTQKALGEFKKLSRELDNKFLVQGLKLDVVKSAFRDITKQFDAAVGEQGFRTAESGEQLRRSLALNLVTLKRFSAESAGVISRDLQSSLRALQAEGKIAGEAVKEALGAAAFFDFAGGEAERRAALKSFTNDFALFAQQTKNLFGASDAGKIQKVLTGQSSVDELFGLDFSAGGAVANRLNQLIREKTDGIANLSSIDPKRRSQIAAQIIKEFRNSPEYKIAQEEFQREQPFAALRLELQGLFSPEGTFGALRRLPGEFKDFQGRVVDRTLLAATAKLLRTIFDREKGLFAILNNTLKEVFGGGFDVLNVIVSGVELLTTGLEKLGEFFQSASFKKFLNIFVPIQKAFDGILSQGFQFDRESINGFISNFFAGIKSLINTVSEYIQGLDAAAIGSVLGSIVTQIAGLIPPLIGLVFEIAKKAFLAIGQSGPGGIALFSGLAGLAIADRGFDLATGQRGGVLGGINRNLRDRTQTRARRIRGGISDITQGRRRGTGLFGSGRRAGNSILNRLLGATERSIAVDYRSGNPDLARPGVFTGWQGEVIRKFNQIIIIMRDSVPVNIRQAKYVPDYLRPGYIDPNRPSGMNMTRDYLRGRGGVRSRLIDSEDIVGATDSYMRRERRMIRNLRRRALVTSGRINRGVRGFMSSIPYGLDVAGGVLDMGEDLVTGDDYLLDEPSGRQRARSADPEVRRRYRRRFGRRAGFARGLRGLGRLGGPLAGGLLTAFSIASLFGGDANASEMEGMTQEEKNEERRARDRQVIGGLAGMAGGALGGAALGSVFGPVGTVIGGALGAFVGEEAIKSLSDPVIDGIGNFGRSIGDWFGGLWEGTKGLFGQAVEGIKGFFGEEGPIQSTWRFFMDIPNKVQELVSSGWDFLGDMLKDVPRALLLGALGPLGMGAGFLIDRLQGRAMGGVGQGLTLVGENGPELIDLGTGSVVYPTTSFGGSRGGRGTTINNVTININAPGAELFANELSSIIVDRLDELYEAERSLGGALA